MPGYVVDCVEKVDIGNEVMVIDKLHLLGDEGRVIVTKNEAIKMVKAGDRIFTFVRTGDDDGYETDLIIKVSESGNEYLTTPLDFGPENNLDNVGECG